MTWTRLAMAATMAVSIPIIRPLGAVSWQAAADRVSADVMLDRAAAYVTAYQQAFTFLVADETYVQRVTIASARPIDEGADPPRERVMRGEMFLTYLAADRRWVALHDVATVDGMAVGGRENLRALLAVSSVQSVAARLFGHNARHNIGTVVRNFNEPTLGLQVLEREQRRRFQFRLLRVDRTAPTSPMATLGFRERERPTLVRNPDGQPIFSSGDLDADVATGEIRRTRIAFRHESVEAELTTTFVRDDRLQRWVPSLFTERYAAGPRDGRPAETIVTEARYENYRRFEATGRIAAPSRP